MKKLAILLVIFTFLLTPLACLAAEDENVDRDLKIRKLELEEKKHDLDERKWEYEVAEKAEKKLKEQLSRSCNIDREIPVITVDAISGSTPDYFRKDMDILWELGHRKIILDIFSGGGDAFAGMGMADTLKSWHNRGVKIEGRAYGLIASAAVPIFASCSLRTAGPSTMFMVHEAAIGKRMVYESASDIKAQKDMLDALQLRYCLILEQNSNVSANEWSSMIKETTWFDTTKALEWGIVDQLE